MGRIIGGGGLTRAGVGTNVNDAEYYDRPGEAAIAFARRNQREVQPALSRVTSNIGEPEVSSFQQPPASALSIFRPTYRESAQDETGNLRLHPSQTKLGKLMTLILGGARGAAAGVGQPNFGAGFAAGQLLPLRVASEQQELRQRQLANQTAQTRLGALPLILGLDTRERRARIAESEAATRYRNAQEASTRALAENRDLTPEEKFARFTEEAQRRNLAAGSLDYDNLFRAFFGKEAAENRPRKANEFDLLLEKHGRNSAAALDEYYKREAGLRSISAGAADERDRRKEQRRADAEEIAAEYVNRANGDPDAALRLFDQTVGRVTDKYHKSLAPEVRAALRGRKQINRPSSPDPLSEAVRQLGAGNQR